jgi:hypothetical protein
MNRPYYALAALVVVLGGSAVAVGSARCQSAAASAASSRALCAAGPRDLVVAANLFVQFDTSWEASRRATFAGVQQGSDDTSLSGYDDSCGYDPYRGERYDAETGDTDDTQALVQEYESWPSDERLESGFRQFEGCEMQPVCGGDELQCPYFAGRADQTSENDIKSSPCEESNCTDDVCQRAHEQWLTEHKNDVRTSPAESLDESAFFVEPMEDAWKTAPVSTPDWITDYLSPCRPSLEEQYAQAELQAARDAEAALADYGPTLPKAPTPEEADYKEEYESLYNLDAYLIPEREVVADEEEKLEDDESDMAPVVWSLGRIFSKVAEMFSDIVPVIEDEADELHKTVDDVLLQWNDFASQLAMSRNDAAVLGPYGEDYDDSLISRDEQNVQPGLPVETVQSREMLTSLASSLRAAGQLLLSAADGLEAEAERVLSAQYRDSWSR